MFIKIQNLMKKLGDRTVFSDVDLMLTDSHKYGIIGKNGSGKTTFLKVILKELIPEKGSVQIDPANAGVAYFSQVLENESLEIELKEINSQKQFEATGFLYLIRSNPQIYSLWKQINTPSEESDYSAIIDEYTEIGGYEFESKIFEITKRLGIDASQKISELSGGQKTRLQLSKILIADANILLLDEPTNHLDQEGLEFFYDFVAKFKGIILIASHDRNLLNNAIDRIILFEDGKVKEYSGNYDFYQKEKNQERIEREERLRLNEKKVAKLNESAKKLSERINKHEEHSRKFNEAVARAARLDKKNKARKTKIIQDKLRLYRDNDKMGRDFLVQRQQVKLSSNRQNLLNRAKKAKDTKDYKIGWSLKLDFETKEIQSDFALKIKDLNAGYDSKELIKNFDLNLASDEKVVVTGPNGVGKSTLLKTIAGEINPLSGEILKADKLKIGYLDQENLSLNYDSVILDEFMKDARSMNDSQARAFLHFFLFEGDMPLRKVRTLSEGEKLKLKLAKLLYSKANLLLLDEPTNHLDIPSQEVVEKALKDYTGSMILVTHDRTLIKNLNIKKEIKLNEPRN